jgi:hypothetical protein
MTPEETKKLHWSKRQNDTFPLGHFRLSYFSLRNAALSASQTLAGYYSTSTDGWATIRTSGASRNALPDRVAFCVGRDRDYLTSLYVACYIVFTTVINM